MSETPLPRRVLVYTHNSIGLGHAVRTMAVIDGLRAALLGADFLVISGTSAPQIFLSEGVEVVKLPGIKNDVDAPGAPYRPRHLGIMDLPGILAWRRCLIRECLEHFAPGLVFVEHTLAGLKGEALPILSAKHERGGFVLAHLSRGIFREKPALLAPHAEYEGLPPGTSLPRLYDRLYVLEDREVVDINAEFLGADPALERTIRYLGRIATCNPDELDTQAAALASLRLTGKPFALVSLGRHGPVEDLHDSVLHALRRLCRGSGMDLLVAPDPYLGPEALEGIRACAARAGARVLPFLPKLARLVASAGLVVCRAGYNTVNDVLLSGARALVIPEHHPSKEQERRASGLPRDTIRVLDERAVLAGGVDGPLAELLACPPAARGLDFDRFRIGRLMAEDLAGLAAGGRSA